MADMVTKGRQPRSVSFGTENGNAKLNEYAVRWIRSHYATGHYTQKELADAYGIKQPAVSAIVLRQTWGHVK